MGCKSVVANGGIRLNRLVQGWSKVDSGRLCEIWGTCNWLHSCSDNPLVSPLSRVRL